MKPQGVYPESGAAAAGVDPALGVTLRPVRAGDEPHLFAVFASTRAAEMAQVPWDDAQKESFLRMQFHAQSKSYQNDYPGAEFQIILVAAQPAGRLYVHRRDEEIRVMDIALLPEFRGRGLGTALLKAVLAEGARTARPVSIHVEAFNPAQRLYQRLGFERIASNGIYHLLRWNPSRAVEDNRETRGGR